MHPRLLFPLPHPSTCRAGRGGAGDSSWEEVWHKKTGALEKAGPMGFLQKVSKDHCISRQHRVNRRWTEDFDTVGHHHKRNKAHFAPGKRKLEGPRGLRFSSRLKQKPNITSLECTFICYMIYNGMKQHNTGGKQR